MKPQSLLVIYDGNCVLCRRSAHWLEHQSTHVPVHTVPATGALAVAAHGHLPGYGDNMVVVADDGRSWVGAPDAYLVVTWAIRGARWLSFMLALPMFKPLATSVFNLIVGNRHRLGTIVGDCGVCAPNK